MQGNITRKHKNSLRIQDTEALMRSDNTEDVENSNWIKCIAVVIETGNSNLFSCLFVPPAYL